MEKNRLATVHHLPLVEKRNTASLIDGAVSCAAITGQYELIVQAMKNVMKDGEHYGTIPGCGDKKTLLKPGAEVLMVLFGLYSEVDITRSDMPDYHREYECKVTIYAPSGRRLGTGVGSCSTMESKYRFRTGPTETTERLVPREYWDLRSTDPKKAQVILGGKGFVAKKGDDSRWYVAIQGEKVENDNPANEYNTVLKMSKKRGLIDAVLNSTGASFLFTQDLEDMLENGVIVIPPKDLDVKGQNRQPPEDYKPASSTESEGQKREGEGNLFGETPAINSPEQIIIALTRKNLNHSTNDQTGEIYVKLEYGDAGNRKFVSDMGFKWDRTDKYWVFKP